MTKRTKTELASQVSSLLPDNTSALISPDDIRSVLTDVGDSVTFWDNSVPSSASDTCAKGEIKFGSTDYGGGTIIHHLYICVDTDTWKRAELATF
jgi:hypothetical protein|tara:strand:+ start:1035 stop:1319 length:285 start_codon:yes stop_codon:yes gene_type:complete